MYDDDTGCEPKIVSASFADPFILLLRDDFSIYVAQCDENNELEEIDKIEKSLMSTKWLSGCIYTDLAGVFTKSRPKKNSNVKANIFMFLLSTSGALYVS